MARTRTRSKGNMEMMRDALLERERELINLRMIINHLDTVLNTIAQWDSAPGEEILRLKRDIYLAAAKRERNLRWQPRLNPDEGRETPWVDEIMSEKEELQ